MCFPIGLTIGGSAECLAAARWRWEYGRQNRELKAFSGDFRNRFYTWRRTSRWWQLKYFFMFTPKNWGRWRKFDELFFTWVETANCSCTVYRRDLLYFLWEVEVWRVRSAIVMTLNAGKIPAGILEQKNWKRLLLEQGEFQQFHGKKTETSKDSSRIHAWSTLWLPVDFSDPGDGDDCPAGKRRRKKLCEMAWMLWAKSGETRGDDRNPCTYCISSSFNWWNLSTWMRLVVVPIVVLQISAWDADLQVVSHV